MYCTYGKVRGGPGRSGEVRVSFSFFFIISYHIISFNLSKEGRKGKGREGEGRGGEGDEFSLVELG